MTIFTYEKFKAVANEFKLGSLTTEKFNPLTTNLSYDSKKNLSKAISSIKQVDLEALSILDDKIPSLFAVYEKIKQVKEKGNKVFLCGCGATGRLSLSIETLALLEGHDHIISFMAGGDYALIKSVESFEDNLDYGRRQLIDLGFQDGDLLLAITEGGETSFVIGAALEAAKISSQESYFLYCNPDEEIKHLKRCSDILNHSKIKKINLTTGPMALSGSTRMQATTVQMFVAGFLVLYNFNNEDEFNLELKKSLQALRDLDYSFLEDFIKQESSYYQKNEIVTYQSDKFLGISVLTDTTERSPTFSLLPFEDNKSKHHCLCYLTLNNTDSAKKAWLSLLGRTPRFINWSTQFSHINLEAIYGFDISANSKTRRDDLGKNHLFSILYYENSVHFELESLHHQCPVANHKMLTVHLMVKLYLNTMSTLIMGRLDRYQSNIMTWVKPSNLKLIDRASRYCQKLLELEGIEVSYDDILREIIKNSDRTDLDIEPVVLRVFKSFS